MSEGFRHLNLPMSGNGLWTSCCLPTVGSWPSKNTPTPSTHAPSLDLRLENFKRVVFRPALGRGTSKTEMPCQVGS